MRLRANVPFAIACCWITNPVTAGPALCGQFLLGDWMRNTLGVPMPYFISMVEFYVKGVGEINAASYILGMITSGVMLALCAYPIVHLFSAVMPQHLPVRRRKLRNAVPAVPNPGSGRA
jgi:uncharacterized protein (DUF2062 family)